MFETVVVGADGSARRPRPCGRQSELLKLTGGRLHIVTAYQSQQIKLSGGRGVRPVAQLG